MFIHHNVEGEEVDAELVTDIAAEEEVILATIETLDVETKTEKTRKVSLNSLVGLDSPKTMKLRGIIRDKQVVVLIDNGALHNFIDEALMKSLNLPLSPTSSYGIMLGTGQSFQATGICKGVVLNLSSLTIVNDFFPLSLGSADVILGVQ